MNLQLWRRYFIVAAIALMLLAISPTIALFVHLPTGSVEFSEFQILDSEHRTDSYPFNMSVGETYTLYVVVKNHQGRSSYYRTYLKFRNSTGSLPSTYRATPSTLPPKYEFNSFVKDGDTWETAVTFRILEAKTEEPSTIIRKLLINDIPINLDVSSVWNATRVGYYYHLFFELWYYDVLSRSFSYHNSFVGIWLRVPDNKTFV